MQYGLPANCMPCIYWSRVAINQANMTAGNASCYIVIIPLCCAVGNILSMKYNALMCIVKSYPICKNDAINTSVIIFSTEQKHSSFPDTKWKYFLSLTLWYQSSLPFWYYLTYHILKQTVLEAKKGILGFGLLFAIKQSVCSALAVDITVWSIQAIHGGNK